MADKPQLLDITQFTPTGTSESQPYAVIEQDKAGKQTNRCVVRFGVYSPTFQDEVTQIIQTSPNTELVRSPVPGSNFEIRRGTAVLIAELPLLTITIPPDPESENIQMEFNLIMFRIRQGTATLQDYQRLAILKAQADALGYKLVLELGK